MGYYLILATHKNNKILHMKGFLLSISLFVLTQITIAQTSYVWNGATSTVWNTPTNWTPSGIPGAVDNVTIVTGGNNCLLPSSIAITNLTITTGVLNLGGNTLTVAGVLSATGGQCNNGTLSATGATQTFSGTNFGANVSVNPSATNDVYFNGSTFGGSVTVTRNNSTNIQSTGNNIFNGVTSITNAGAGYLLLTNNAARPDAFNAALTLNTSNTGNLYVGYTGNVTFAANVVVNNTSGSGSIQFGRVGGGAATLNTGFTITTGSFAGGTLLLQNFTQVGSTALNLSPGVNGGVNIYSATINGNLTVSAGDVYTRNATYAGTVSLTKLSGTNANNMVGGNTFASTLTINYTSSTSTGYWGFAGTTADIYNGDVYVNNNSTDRILWGVGSSPISQFNGNLILTQIGSSVGISTAWSAGSGCTIAAGKTISIGVAGYSVGYLFLQGVTQNGNVAMNLTLTGTASIYVGEGASYTPSTFGGTFTVSAPDVFFRGGTFNAAVTVTKTGTGSDHNNGRLNTFNSTCTINQQGSAGYFMLGYNSADAFNDDITITSTGAGAINLGWSSGTGTPTLASGKTILVGAGGFSAGSLYLGAFTQLGSAAMNLTFTGTTTITFARSSVIGGNLTTSSADVYFNGCTFNGTVNSTKTGAGSDVGTGGNTFNGVSSFTNSGAGYLMFGNSSADIWNADVTFTNTGTERILPCWTAAGNQFNGNITFNNTGSALGINFCGNATATATQAAGYSISIGGSGYTSGYLILARFTQLGSSAINLTLASTASYIQFGPASSFGGPITSSSPGIYFNSSTFSSAVNSSKTGASSDASPGGNTFQSSTTLNNSGSGYLMMGNGSPDIFNGDLNLNNTGTERFLMAWNSVGTQLNGNLIVSNTATGAGIYFCGNATATTIMAATKNIQIGAAGFNTGYLILPRFTQLGSAASNLTFTGASTYITIGPSSAIGGDFTVVSPRILANGAVYSGNVNFTKNGSTGEWSTGGNTFNGTTTINMLGSGYFGFANGSPDIYNGDLYVNNNSTERVIFANSPVGNQFNGNIILTQIGSSVGIAFGWSASTNETMAAGKTISIGAAGFSVGYLQLMRFTQLGNVAVNLPLTGTASLTFGPSSAIGGNMTSTSATLLFNGCTFSGTVDATKNGSSNDGSTGSNIFNGATTITNSGSGYVQLGNGSLDQFNATSTFNNTGSSTMYIADNSSSNIFAGVATFNNTPTANTVINVSRLSTGTVFNDNIVVTSTNGQGVQFCGGNVTATATLSATKTISIGAGGFSAGTLLLKQFTQVGATAQSLTLTGTGILTYGPSSSFGGDVTSVSPTLYFNGCTYNGTTNITKNGTTGDYSVGGNIFNGVTTITNSGSSYLLMGNASPDIWNNDVTFTNTGSERILPCWATSGNQFNGNIYVNTSGSAQGIQFCGGNTTATATLAATKTIAAGSTGLNAGYLILKQFTQLGSAAINLTLSNTATYLQYGPTSTLGGNVTSTSPGLFFNGCTFNGIVNCTKNGSTSDASVGNNIFNAATTMTNSGAGYLLFGNGNADQFNSTSTFNNTGSNSIFVAYNSSNNIFGGVTTFNNAPTSSNPIYVSYFSTGTVFNDNIVVTSTSGTGVQFCAGNATATATLSAAKTITIGAGGFSAGTLLLKQFTQTGATAQALTLTGTGNLTFGSTSAFGGDVTTVSPTLFFNGCTFSGITTCTKNGSTNDFGIGNNIFTGVSTITNSGSGYLAFGNGSRDQWLTDVTFNNTGSNIIYVAANAANNTFGGNVVLNNVGSTGNNNGIYFCNNANATASITGNLTITNNPTSGTTNGIRICEGNTTSFSVGGTTSITNVNNGISNYIRFGAGTGSACTFTGDVTVNNNGTTASANAVHFSYTGSSTFNGNVILNSTGGAGVVFGNSGGTSTQANNKTINTSTFTGGPLYLRNFVQSGPTTGNTSNVSITGANQLLTFNGSSFYDNVTGSSQQITATTSTFRGTTALTKVSGNANDYSLGGNTFNGTTTITNQSPTYVLGMANGTADAYNGNVTFVQSAAGVLSPSYNANCTYAGNITITSPAGVAMTFGSGGGTSTMNGSSGGQTINITTGLTPVFTRFTMNHTGTGVTLNTPINLSTNLTMTNGVLNTTATNILTMLNASTASALTSASTSYVSGPMKYQKSVAGSTILNFPIGKGSDCRPVVLTVNHTAATLYNYTSEVFNTDPWVAMSSGAPYVATNMPQTVDTISKIRYWNIARTDGAGASQPSTGLSGNQQIQLYFGTNDQVYQGGSLTIVKNTSGSPAAWIDIGGSCALGNFSSGQAGSVTSTSAPSAFTSFSAFTLGSKADFGWNPLPIELLYFDAKPVNNTVDLTWATATETNNKFFTIEKSKNGIDFEFLQNINSEALNGNSKTTLNYRTYDLNPYIGVNYYRLKQTDYNGNFKYANIAQVNFDKKSFVSVFPNPASNNLFINVSSDYDNASVKFMDALGREVLTQNISSSNVNAINTGSLSPGIYYVIIDNGSGEVNKTKITIQQ